MSVINESVAGTARAVAGELAPRYGARIRLDVEAAIQEGGEPKASGQYFDPIALGALILAVTQFAYQVRKDRQKKGHKASPDAIARAVRIERQKYSDLAGVEKEIIEIVSRRVTEFPDDE